MAHIVILRMFTRYEHILTVGNAVLQLWQAWLYKNVNTGNKERLDHLIHRNLAVER